MADRAFKSIGEVLSLLKEEFPDVTISKIRFLESQGLLDPERTPSGYRKFYEADVERLRWILRQQRENFLPLKVIKGRLSGDLSDLDEDSAPPAPAPEPAAVEVVPEPAAVGVAPPPFPPQEAPPPPPAPEPPATPTPAPAADGAVLSTGLTAVNLTFDELASASGLPAERLRDLERSGFISGRPVAGSVFYDEDALVVANLAAGFARFGVETRHLRMYKNAAEREADLFEQIVTPLLKQRNPHARHQAVETLESLTHLGQSLRAAMLRKAVKGLTSG